MNSEASLPVGIRVLHRHYGEGRILRLEPPFYVVKFKEDTIRVPFDYKEMAAASNMDPQLEQLMFALREVLDDFGVVEPDRELGRRWQGGELVLVPGKKDTQEKRLPLESFFKKIVGVREKLRVLEQKINNHPALSSEDRLELQGYITRCYGSLTSFNALFSEEGTPFKGQSGD